MSWRTRVNISWRWIIRGTCLGLLGLCVALWGLSYFYNAGVTYNRRGVNDNDGFVALLGIRSGTLSGSWSGHDPYSLFSSLGWSLQASSAMPGESFSLHLIDGDFLGFTVSCGVAVKGWYVGIPLWCPTLLLALISLLAWRKTGRGGTGRGFPVEPLTSRPDIAGG